MLSEEEKQEFVDFSVQKYKKFNKPLYLLYKDYNEFEEPLINKGDLQNIVAPNDNIYGIATLNKEYVCRLLDNGFKLLYKI